MTTQERAELVREIEVYVNCDSWSIGSSIRGLLTRCRSALLAAARAQEQDRKHAERYRWLREASDKEIRAIMYGRALIPDDEDLDNLVDTFIAASPINALHETED